MKTNARRTVKKTAPAETPELLRVRLAAFARYSRASAARRKAIVEPTVNGSVLNGRRVRVSG